MWRLGSSALNSITYVNNGGPQRPPLPQHVPVAQILESLSTPTACQIPRRGPLCATDATPIQLPSLRRPIQAGVQKPTARWREPTPPQPGLLARISLGYLVVG